MADSMVTYISIYNCSLKIFLLRKVEGIFERIGGCRVDFVNFSEVDGDISAVLNSSFDSFGDHLKLNCEKNANKERKLTSAAG